MENEDTQAQIARRHDLTGTVAPYLDPHMFLMVLESHSSGSIPIYEIRSLLKEGASINQVRFPLKWKSMIF